MGDRQKLSTYVYQCLGEHAPAFQDLHYVYAVVKAGRSKWVKKILLSMQEHGRTVNPFLRNSWLEVAISTATQRYGI